MTGVGSAGGAGSRPPAKRIPEPGCRLMQADPARNRLSWRLVVAEAARSASILTRRQDPRVPPVEDLVQEALLRLLAALRQGVRVTSPVAWLHGTMRHMIADAMRSDQSAPAIPLSLEQVVEQGLNPPLAGTSSDPERAAVLSDLEAVAPALLDHLPPPYRQIARLQYLEGASRREITTWLQAWRPVGADHARRLIRRTHALLRALGDGQDPDVGASAKKNVWSMPPPRSYDVSSSGRGVRPNGSAVRPRRHATG